MLVIELVVDCCIVGEPFIVDGLCELISTEVIGAVLTIVDVEDWIGMETVLVLLNMFVDAGDAVDTAIDADDIDRGEVDESLICIVEGIGVELI
jgi:hypothetical protein